MKIYLVCGIATVEGKLCSQAHLILTSTRLQAIMEVREQYADFEPEIIKDVTASMTMAVDLIRKVEDA